MDTVFQHCRPTVDNLIEAYPGHNFILFGRPGSGKGTLAYLFQQKGYKHVGVGQLIHRHLEAKTELSQRFQNEMGDQLMMPDTLACDMVLPELTGNGLFVLEGFPVTVRQYMKFKDFASLSKFSYAFILLDVSKEAATKRLLSRGVCFACQIPFLEDIETCLRCEGGLEKRYDDTPDLINQRQQLFEKHTEVLKANIKRDFTICQI